MDFWPDGSLADEKSVGELFSSRITLSLTKKSRGLPQNIPEVSDGNFRLSC
jgi:hypothetical protein